jgi:hypothetical protein
MYFGIRTARSLSTTELCGERSSLLPSCCISSPWTTVAGFGSVRWQLRVPRSGRKWLAVCLAPRQSAGGVTTAVWQTLIIPKSIFFVRSSGCFAGDDYLMLLTGSKSRFKHPSTFAVIFIRRRTESDFRRLFGDDFVICLAGPPIATRISCFFIRLMRRTFSSPDGQRLTRTTVRRRLLSHGGRHPTRHGAHHGGKKHLTPLLRQGAEDNVRPVPALDQNR